MCAPSWPCARCSWGDRRTRGGRTRPGNHTAATRSEPRKVAARTSVAPVPITDCA
jgi:hypothetical protein